MVAKLGSEFQVNTYTVSTQDRPAIAVDGNGNFIVTWVSLNQDGDSFGIYAQRFDDTGTPLGTEFQVNTYTTTEQDSPHLTAYTTGNFIITWVTRDQDGNTFEIAAQQYNNAGTPVGSEFQVNTYTNSDQSNTAIAVNPGNGNFIIAWNSDGQDSSLAGIYAQRFDISGTPLGSEFQVNTYTPNIQNFPRIASDYNGNFVITWNSYGQDGNDFGIYARRYDATGTPLSSEFKVNTYTTGSQFRPDIAFDSNGDFIITWQSLSQDGNGFGIYGQRYDNTGTPLGSEFRVNTYTQNSQIIPRIATDRNDNFIITWESYQDGYSYGIYAQRYDSLGVPVGSEFQVNTYTTFGQRNASLALDDTGNFIVTWESVQDGDDYGIYAQRFGKPDVNIVTSSPNINEDTTTPTLITFNLNGIVVGQDLPINFQLNGDANYGGDYLISSNATIPTASNQGTVIIPNGNSSVTFTLTPIDDSLVETTELITFEILSRQAYNLGTMVSAALSLFDNDIPTVNLIAGNDPNEAGLTAGNFLFTLDQPAFTDITLFYTVNPSAATPGTDYLPLSGTITVPGGQTSVSLSVFPLDDDLSDPNETINLSLNSAPGYTLGTSINATLTIIDNDTPGVTLTQSEGFTEVTEGSSTPDTYTLALNTVPLEPVTLTVTADPQLQISSDGNSFTSILTLSFSDTLPQTISVLAVNDTIIEEQHRGEITHQIITQNDPNYHSNVQISPLIVNILDDDLVPSPIPINTPPVANPDSVTTLINTPVTIAVLDNDFDLDEGNIIQIQQFNFMTENGGTLTLEDQGTVNREDDRLIYTPATNFVGVDTFDYTITDGEATSTATVSVLVELMPRNLPQLQITLEPRLPPLPNRTVNRLQAIANGSILMATRDPDEIIGTDQDDLLFGLSGDDNIFGLEGNDRLYGNEGTDFLVGDLGNDRLIGGLDNDALFGDEGDDLLLGGPGNDFILGGQDQDLLQGDAGEDYLEGNRGNDTVYGGDGDDVALGNTGDDVLLGNNGNDTLIGSEDHDSLLGGMGADILSGDAGNDTLEGGEGDDSLLGGEGDDCLVGGLGNDILQGGNGVDTFFLAGNAGIDTIYDFNPDEDVLSFSNDLSLAQLEIIQMAEGVVLKLANSNEILAHVFGITVSEISIN